MSIRVRTIHNRGRYFIETGTASSFRHFVANNKGKLIFIPESLLKRIEHFIETGDVSSALQLWFKVCQMADAAPWRMGIMVAKVVFHLLVGGMALYSFLHLISG